MLLTASLNKRIYVSILVWTKNILISFYTVFAATARRHHVFSAFILYSFFFSILKHGINLLLMVMLICVGRAAGRHLAT
jgi:hypothetical protein